MREKAFQGPLANERRRFKVRYPMREGVSRSASQSERSSQRLLTNERQFVEKVFHPAQGIEAEETRRRL